MQCWGSGGVDAQAGSSISLLEPTPIEGIDDATALAAGDDFTCAIVSDGVVKCWGEGDVGQLGDGTFHNGSPWWVNEPFAGGVFEDTIVEVACGETHTCIRTSQNHVQCIGQGTYGQLGDGSFHSTLPFGIAAPFTALEL